ncbi:7,8-didemethyl-8-hydroxy-5-deazariboflavin synthase [Panacagrimonas perspica]|nr:7,8-didemethyl-8-hydroxy-5-deazariboflavin synthase [Panacagrimonas perspica]
MLGESPSVLMTEARTLRDKGHGDVISYSRKVFIPLTQLCRDVCYYCTFSRAPRAGRPAYLTTDQVMDVVRQGEAAGCHEALFTLGDKPELRWDVARRALEQMGFASTVDYLHACASKVVAESRLLPHLNAGVLTTDEMRRLREVSVSMGLMLESASPRLMEPGQVHFGSPDKDPTLRLKMIDEAGALRIPFTSGLLIGIGETRAERVESLLALRHLHERHGHLQEIIIQNFRAKPGTPMARAPEPDLEDLLWTVAAARIIFGAGMNIQAPPNLTPQDYGRLVEAGINDWGGISPVTRDHVNPEAPWPQVAVLEERSARAGKALVERLAIYPSWAEDSGRWLDPAIEPRVLKLVDARGWPRTGQWISGSQAGDATDFQFDAPAATQHSAASSRVRRILDRCRRGITVGEAEVVDLFNATGADLALVIAEADRLRQETVGDRVSFVVNRNINYTNVCLYKCTFCAFSKGKGTEQLRGPAYDLSEAEVRRRVREAWERGATEVCMQGGIHPGYTGETYLNLLRMVKEEEPRMHIHAFSPLEVSHGASTLGLPVSDYLRRLKEAGLGTLPGTAAEILDDDVRAVICPDKLSTQQWLDVLKAAHETGLRTTSTIMFGHIERPVHWARHLLALRTLQIDTGGITEFVPLPFVPMEAPMFLRGRARSGPTAREAVLMHAVSRLVLNPYIRNIQVSWVKLGPLGVRAALAAGANDLGGTLMNESISRAAGSTHGQEMNPVAMESLIQSCGRRPHQRTTAYGVVPEEQRAKSFVAAALAPIELTPFRPTRKPRVTAVHQEL